MELKDLYMGINRGKRYTLKSDFIREAEAYTSGEHRYFTPWARLYLVEDWAGDYIGWSHYGSSAKENTMDGLEWILKNIFKKTPADFIEIPE